MALQVIPCNQKSACAIKTPTGSIPRNCVLPNTCPVCFFFLTGREINDTNAFNFSSPSCMSTNCKTNILYMN